MELQKESTIKNNRKNGNRKKKINKKREPACREELQMSYKEKKGWRGRRR
jgi:hypothetical protein